MVPSSATDRAQEVDVQLAVLPLSGVMPQPIAAQTVPPVRGGRIAHELLGS